jgi:hypothetical protein
MIRRSTVVYILILLVLVGAYFYIKNRPKSADIALTPAVTDTPVAYLFTSDEGVPSTIRIQSQAGEIVEVTRDASAAWVLTQPIAAKADQGSAEAAATQVETMRVLNKVPNLDPKIAGLQTPEYVLTVKFKSKVERTVNIGVVTPSENGYFVQDASGGDVQVVSKSAVDALLGMLTTPPYLETLTPSPTPTGTILPTATPAMTANETATPQP